MEPVQLDEEKLEALRTWGERLRQSTGEESAAVGRAILMLVEEIDRLHIELWHTRMLQPREEEAAAAGGATEEPVSTSLHVRLQHALRREVPAALAEEPAAPEPESATKQSGQAWIAALRRQK